MIGFRAGEWYFYTDKIDGHYPIHPSIVQPTVSLGHLTFYQNFVSSYQSVERNRNCNIPSNEEGVIHYHCIYYCVVTFSLVQYRKTHFSIQIDVGMSNSDKVNKVRNVGQGYRIKVRFCKACQGQLQCKGL